MPIPVPTLIELTDDERAQLKAVGAAAVKRAGAGVAVADRAGRGRGPNNTEIAAQLGIAVSSVRKWRNRFAEHRLDGLTDEPRPGRPRTISDEQVEAVITRTLESTPKDATHWSTRSMAAEVGLTQTAVSRIWRAFGLQPHRQETFKLSKVPLFVDKVHDVVGLYLKPPERAVVLCVDEAGQRGRHLPCRDYLRGRDEGGDPGRRGEHVSTKRVTDTSYTITARTPSGRTRYGSSCSAPFRVHHLTRRVTYGDTERGDHQRSREEKTNENYGAKWTPQPGTRICTVNALLRRRGRQAQRSTASYCAGGRAGDDRE